MFFATFVLINFLARLCHTSSMLDDSLWADDPAILNDDDSSNLFGSSTLVANNANLNQNLFVDDISAAPDLDLPEAALDSTQYDSR